MSNGKGNCQPDESSLRGKYPGRSAHKDNPRSAAMGRNHSIVLELLIGTVRSSGVMECQHERIQETVGLIGSVSAGDIVSFRKMIKHNYERAHEDE
jgi:hypothetical protein